MPPNLDVYYGGADDDDYTHRGGMSRAYGEFSRSGDSERSSPYYHGRGNHDAAPPHPPPAATRRRGHPVSSNGTGKTNNGRTKTEMVDFEDFSTDAEKLSAILKLGDVEMHKHMLSADYYRFRKYLLLAPTVISSLSIAMMGFVAASDVIEDRMRVGDASMRQFLVLLVSCLGFLVLILTVLGNGLDYVTKLASHRAAAEDLMGLCDRVRLYRMERAMDERARDEGEELGSGAGGTETTDESDDDDDDDDEEGSVLIPMGEDRIMHYRGGGEVVAVAARRQVRKKMRQTKRVHRRNARLTKNLVDDKVRRAREEQDLSKDAITFYGYHTELRQISRGCRSDVPPRISKFFSVMENRVELMSLSRLGVEEDSRMRKNQIVRLCANEIYNEVSNYAFWPVFAPNVDRTIEGAMRRVGQLLNMNYRARRRCKLIPCCPVPLCCKKKTSDNVFVIINEGIDQRELDLMQAERIELLRMEKDRRDRRNAGPEEVLVVNDTFYVDDGHGRGGAVPRLGYRNPPKMIGNDDERSRATRDPEGSVFTPASGAHTRAGDGDDDSQSYSFKTGKGAGMYPRDRDGYMIEDDDGMMDDDVDYVSRYSASEFEGEKIAKKSKKSKKKSKKSKKKSKKSKTKKKDKGDSGEDTDEYDEEEEGGGYGRRMMEDDEEHGTVFSERYSTPSSKNYSAAGSQVYALEEGEDHGTIHSEKHSVASKSQYSAAPPGVGGGSNYSFASSTSSSRYSAALGSAAAAASQVKAFSVLSRGNSSGQSSSKKYSVEGSGKSGAGRGSKFSTASGVASGKFSVQSSRGISAASSGKAVAESDGGRSQFSTRSSRRYSTASSGRSSAQSAMHSEQTDGRSEYSAQSAMHRSEYSSLASARNSERTSMHSGASTQYSEGGGSAAA